MKYTVQVERIARAIANIEVEADDRQEASIKAMQQAERMQLEESCSFKEFGMDCIAHPVAVAS